jgi:hypothetical protein
MRAAVPSSNDAQLGELVDGSNSASSLGLLQTTLVPQTLRHYMPTWLGGGALAGMLKALKVAAESYLETTVCIAETVLPFYFARPYDQILSKASASVSLSLPFPIIAPAGIWAARAYGLAGECYGPNQTPDRLIVTIEYSRAALTALLVDEECGIFEYRRVVHDPRLGLDGIDGSEASWSDLERALRKLTELPLQHGNGEGLKHISSVVVFGESARDSRMQNALRNVLGERYNSLATADGAIQPLFAAARCAAWYTWTRLNPSEEAFICDVSNNR